MDLFNTLYPYGSIVNQNDTDTDVNSFLKIILHFCIFLFSFLFI